MAVSIPLPQINWRGKKERSQMCVIFTSDGREENLELDALHGSIQNSKLATQDAFILSAENQFFDEDDNTWKQLINEMSGVPICMIKPMEKEEVEKRWGDIFENASVSAMIQKQKEAMQSVIWEKLTWIVSIVFGSFIVIAAIQYFKG